MIFIILNTICAPYEISCLNLTGSLGKPEWNRPFTKPRNRREIILEWILGKKGRKLWTGCIWIRIGTREHSCEHGNEPLGSIKGGEFLD
jgi:hypothetical protein